MDLLPAIDLRGGRVVRLRRGVDSDRTEYDVAPQVALGEFAAAGVERVHVVDLDAAFGEAPQRRLVAELAAMPGAPRIELGGGLRDREAVEWALGQGVDRVVLTSMLVRDPALFAELAERYPGRLVAALDVADGRLRFAGWTESSPRPLDDVCAELRELPLAAVLVTDIERDGTLSGPNFELTVAVAEAVGVGGLLSGGVRSLEDLARARELSVIAGAVVGKALYDGAIDLGAALAVCRDGRAV